MASQNIVTIIDRYRVIIIIIWIVFRWAASVLSCDSYSHLPINIISIIIKGVEFRCVMNCQWISNMNMIVELIWTGGTCSKAAVRWSSAMKTNQSAAHRGKEGGEWRSTLSAEEADSLLHGRLTWRTSDSVASDDGTSRDVRGQPETKEIAREKVRGRERDEASKKMNVDAERATRLLRVMLLWQTHHKSFELLDK